MHNRLGKGRLYFHGNAPLYSCRGCSGSAPSPRKLPHNRSSINIYCRVTSGGTPGLTCGYRTVRHPPVKYRTVRHLPVKYRTVRHPPVKYRTVRRNFVSRFDVAANLRAFIHAGSHEPTGQYSVISCPIRCDRNETLSDSSRTKNQGGERAVRPAPPDGCGQTTYDLLSERVTAAITVMASSQPKM
jgi:hypothetical protein